METIKKKPKDSGSKIVTTQSAPAAFPSALRLKKSAVQTIAAGDLQTEAEIKQKCPECAREKMWFYTLQLRSADEGVRPSPCSPLLRLLLTVNRRRFSTGANAVTDSIPTTRLRSSCPRCIFCISMRVWIEYLIRIYFLLGSDEFFSLL